MRRWRTPAVIVLLAVVLRIVAVVHVGAVDHVAGENRQIAMHLAGGQGFSFLAFSNLGPTSVRAPVFPYLLAGFYALFGVDATSAHLAALALNVLCGGISTALVIALTRRWWIGLTFALWPTQVYAATQMQGLSLAVTVLLAALLLLQRVRPIGTGIVAAMAVLTESILVLPLLFAIVVIFRRKPVELFVCLLAMLTLTLPWVYRNTLVHRRATLITDTLGPDLFLGNGNDATGSQHLRIRDFTGDPLSQIDRLTPPQYDQLKRQPEAVRDAKMFGWATGWIRSHPLQYAKLCLVRAAKTLWLDWDHPMAWKPLNLLPRTLALLICVIAACLAPSLVYSRDRAEVRASSARSDTTEKALTLTLCREYPGEGTTMLLLLMVAAFVFASMFTLAEARNAVLIDVPQLLLMAVIADRSRTTAGASPEVAA